MSSPIIWIVIPAGVSLVLALLRKWERLTIVLGALLGLGLAMLAWQLPESQTIDLGPIEIEISSTLEVLGRRFVLSAPDRPILAVIYGIYAFWAAGALASRPGRLFAPFGLAVVALLTAAIAVEPFLYAAVLIQMAALVCVPILSKPGHATGSGVTRFLTFQMLGTPLILMTGWLLERADVTGGQEFPVQAAIFLALGFIFLLAVFPFHTWLPMLAEQAHPYSAAFVLFILPGIITIFGLGFVERYAWLRADPAIATFLRVAGGLMILTSGIWAAFEHNLGRIAGFAALVDTGLALIIASTLVTGTPVSESINGIFLPLLAARALAMGLWALALSLIRRSTGTLAFDSIQGAGRKLPLAATAVILANLSLAGFPLLPGFPARLELLEQISLTRPVVSITILSGSLGLAAAGLRSLAVLVTGDNETAFEIREPGLFQVLLIVGTIALIAAGLTGL